jgi:UDP-N-acetyl-2-amino-2-deoxyglucuronate dehydrogenase
MRMKIGLIGAGNISETHARAASSIPGVEVVAVYGTNAEKTKRLAAECSAAAFRDLDAFLSHRPMDMVIIGSPSGMHAEQGIATAEHGLHVLVEKPIDISSERADALIAACDLARVKLGVIFQERFQPGILRVKDLVANGTLGKLLLIDAQLKWYRKPEYYSASRWHGTRAMDGGGALINQGVHTVDVLLWLFGEVARVQARTAAVAHDIEVEDTAMAILEFENGALGVLQVTTAAYPGYERRMEITGTEGTLILEGERVVAADLRTKQEGLLDTVDDSSKERASSSVVSDVRGHQSAIEDFILAIETNGTPACDGGEGKRSLALIERIYQAARTQKENE